MKPNISTGKIILCFLLILISSTTSNSQSFQAVLGGSGFERCNDVAATSDNGYILTGATTSFGSGSYDVYITKITAAGVLQWTRTVGGTGQDEGYAVSQTADGGYLVTGYTTSFTSGANDIYLIRLNSSGTLLWTKTFGTPGNDIGECVLEINGGGIVVLGYSSPTLTSVPDGYLIRTDASGNLVTCKRIGGAGNDYMHHIIRTYDNGYAIAGSTLSAGPVNYQAWVVKLDSSFNMMWNKHIGGTNNENASSIVQTADSGLAVAGYTASFGAGGQDLYLMKLNKSGNLMWTRTTGGAQNEQAASIEQTSDNGLLLGGFSYSYAGSPDSLSYLVKFNASGNLLGRTGRGGYGGKTVQSYSQNEYLQISAASVNGSDFYLAKFNWALSICGVGSQFVLVNATGGTFGSVVTTITTETPIIGTGGTASSGGTLTILSGPPNTPGTIIATGGNTKVCPGTVKTYSVAVVAGATSYQWYAPFGSSVTSGQGTNSVTVTFAAGFGASDTLRVIARNSCGDSPQSKIKITRNNPGKPGVVTGQNFGICNVGPLPYSVPLVAGVTYNWTLNNTTASITSGQGTNAVTITYNPGFLTAVVSVIASNSCGSSAARTYNLYAKPSTPLAITGNLAVCANQQTVPYSITPVSYATTYTWISPSGSHINDGTTISPLNTLTTTATAVTVNYAANGGTLKVRGNNACTAGSYKSATVAIVCRSIQSETTTFSLLPNPAEDLITINSGNAIEIIVRIFDPAGREVTVLKVQNGSETYNIEHLSPGIYFYSAFEGLVPVATGKLIKK